MTGVAPQQPEHGRSAELASHARRGRVGSLSGSNGRTDYAGKEELVDRLLAGVQEHVHAIRSSISAAADSVERLRSAADLSSELHPDVHTLTTEWTSVMGHLGELQLMLAAAAQSRIALDGAGRACAAGDGA